MGLSGSSRSFDLTIVPLDSQTTPEQQFLNIEHPELKGLVKYFKASNIKMREVDIESRQGQDLREDDMDDED